MIIDQRKCKWLIESSDIERTKRIKEYLNKREKTKRMYYDDGTIMPTFTGVSIGGSHSDFSNRNEEDRIIQERIDRDDETWY